MAHATKKLYGLIAVVLCLITFAEWGIFKIESLRTNALVMIPSLLILSIAKFALVCGFYMHLRYDHRWLWQIFTVSSVFAICVFLILSLALS
jgi:hypothetical protein